MIFLPLRSSIVKIPFIALWLVLVSSPGWGAASKSHVTADLVSDVKSVRSGHAFWAAIRMRIEPGWHVYWKNSGDSGLPTRVQWKLPAGFTAGPLQWPAPSRIEEPPFITFGYKDEVWLLASLQPSRLGEGKTVLLAARVDWLECSDICIPGRADVSLNLPASAAAPEPDLRWAEDFAEARFRLPLPGSDWTVRAFQGDGKVRLTVMSPDSRAPAGLEFFPEDPSVIESINSKNLFPRGDGAVLEYDSSTVSGDKPQRLKGVLVNPEGWRGAGSEQALAVDVPLEPWTGNPAIPGFWMAILLAFAGGLLLNLMPCVLPVLSIKILGFVNQAHGDRKAAARHGLLFAAGVLASFWALAALLLVFRAGGRKLGWGFQLQSPVFVAGLACLFLLLGLNLLGFFELGGSFVGFGSLVSGRSGHRASFLSGILAAIVATPCTAPFMGTALGFALTQPAGSAFSLFTALGAGMATPYFVLSSSPALMRFVPKPGRWMETLKRIMALPLMGTVVWLMWILGRQTGMFPAAALGGTLAALSLAAWFLGPRTAFAGAGNHRWISGIILLLTATGGLWVVQGSLPSRRISAAGLSWETYSTRRLAELRGRGVPVFIDFTAAWCLTCQVNERTALASPDVARKFKELGIVTMKADWTSRDDAITRALEEYGRSGVPLYVLHGRDSRRPPLILPAILTPKIVLQALEKI